MSRRRGLECYLLGVHEPRSLLVEIPRVAAVSPTISVRLNAGVREAAVRPTRRAAAKIFPLLQYSHDRVRL